MKSHELPLGHQMPPWQSGQFRRFVAIPVENTRPYHMMDATAADTAGCLGVLGIYF